MTGELLQLAAVLGIFAVVAAVWLFVIFLPGRTMEDWQDKRAKQSKEKKPKLP